MNVIKIQMSKYVSEGKMSCLCSMRLLPSHNIEKALNTRQKLLGSPFALVNIKALI